MLINVVGITLGLDVGIFMGSSDGSFDGYNYGKLKRQFIVDSLWSTDGKLLVSDEGVIWDNIMVKCLELYLKMYIE